MGEILENWICLKKEQVAKDLKNQQNQQNLAFYVCACWEEASVYILWWLIRGDSALH